MIDSESFRPDFDYLFEFAAVEQSRRQEECPLLTTTSEFEQDSLQLDAGQCLVWLLPPAIDEEMILIIQREIL